MGLRNWFLKGISKKVESLQEEINKMKSQIIFCEKVNSDINNSKNIRYKNEDIDNRLAKRYSSENFNIYCKNNNISIHKTASLVGDVIIEKNVSIKDYSYISYRSIVFELCDIGKYCSISFNVFIGVTSHPSNWLSTHPFQYAWRNQLQYNKSIPTKIGNDVWIGANVVIQTGVTVGDGVIIGSGAVVTKDIPPYAIVAGVPAKIIRYRFDEDTIKQLLELKWWDIDADVLLNANVNFDDIHKAIDQVKKIKGC